MARYMAIEDFIKDIRRQLKDVGKYGDRVIITYKGKPSSILINFREYDDYDDYIHMIEKEELLIQDIRDLAKLTDATQEIQKKLEEIAKEENDGSEEVQQTIDKVLHCIASKRLEEWLKAERRDPGDSLKDREPMPPIDYEAMDKALDEKHKEWAKEILKEELYEMFMKIIDAEKKNGGHNLH